MAPQVQRKARERLQANSDLVGKAIVDAMKRQGVTAQTAGRGLPAPWGERLQKALEIVEGRYEQAVPKSPPRRATRPAGPPTQRADVPVPVPEAAVAQPERPESVRTAPEPPRRAVPAFAEPTEPPKRALMSAEDALADVAAANRRAGATRRRRRR